MITQTSFEMVLWIPTLKKEGNLNFGERKQEINEAVEHFNKQFIGQKQLSIIQMGSNRLVVELTFFTKKETASGRDLIKFSQYLANEKKWENYSTDKSKLFRLLGTPLKKFNVQKTDEEPVIEKEIENFTDEAAFQAFQTLISMQHFGSDEIKKKKKKAINQIKAVLLKTL